MKRVVVEGKDEVVTTWTAKEERLKIKEPLDTTLFGKQDELLTTLNREKTCVRDDLEAATKARERITSKVYDLTNRLDDLTKAIKKVEAELPKEEEK